MNNMGISTDPALLDVELPRTLIESPSVSTFLPDEEASICPLLSTNNGTCTPLTFSHPLTPCADTDDNTPTNLCSEDAKVETSSSTGSSSGIGMDVTDTAATALFSKHAYQHLQKNNNTGQDANNHGANCNLTLTEDTPSFVSWNWPLIRKCTFFVFMSSLFAMCALVVAMVVTLPKTCNPKTAWYRGGVFYEIFPASFQDSNNDGIGDIRGIGSRVDYLVSLGVSAVRLNSIFPSTNYPDDFENVTSLMDVSGILGTISDVRQLAVTLHSRNLSLIIDLPVTNFISKYIRNKETDTNKIPDENITDAINMWMTNGVDGFYVKGLEDFVTDNDVPAYLAEWKRLLGSNRVLIVGESLINEIHLGKIDDALSNIDLVDVHLDILNDTKYLVQRIQSILSSKLTPTENGAWIHWTLGGVHTERLTRFKQSPNITLAATLMQLMLPGTPSIFYGDEVALEGLVDPNHNDTKHLHHLATMPWSSKEHKFTSRETLSWLPQTASYNFDNFQLISKMIALRDRSPSIYKNAICKTETALPNTQIQLSHSDIMVVERVYPRRNSFVSVSNFGKRYVKIDMTSKYYSGIDMLGQFKKSKVYFNDFEIGPLETIVVKLDK